MERRVVIIDDEPLILSGLSTKIDWESVNCRVTGTASNGMDGLKLIEEQLPDIVVSDIVMPFCTGLELAEKCAQLYPNVQVILLSAYSDFAYAQQAIRLGIADYVLKPVEPEMLLTAVRQAVERIEQEESRQKNLSRLEGEHQVSLRYASSFLLFEAAHQGPRVLASGLEKNLDELLRNPGAAMMLKLHNIPLGQEDVCRSMMQEAFLGELERRGFRVFCRTATVGTAVLCQLPHETEQWAGESQIRHAVCAAMENVKEAFQKAEMRETICVCMLADTYKNAEELQRIYQQCVDESKESFFATECCVIEQRSQKKRSGAYIDIQAAVHHLKNGNAEQASRELEDILEKISGECSVETAMILLKNLHFEAMQVCAMLGMPLKTINGSKYEQENFEMKADHLREFFQMVGNYAAASRDMVSRMKLLIQEHYMEFDFGLSQAAEILGVSSSYLSRLFKKETGENFGASLLAVRLKKAEYLLKTTGMNVTAVANEVGFQDGAYFTQVFRKSFQMTPSQYRETEKNRE
ncbi:MAG: response regulator [Eubacteriales bacterium]|nr:response regulator [Eubacteriales bacterium]